MKTKRRKASGKGVAAYMRVSTRRQKHDSQEKVLKEYVANHGLDVKWYRDTCSGKTVKRPGFDRLQADIFAGRIGRVLVARLDRVSRKMVDGVRVLGEWTDKGVEVTAVAQGLDFNGSSGRLMGNIMLALAEWERELLIERTCEGMDAARAKGVVIGRRKGDTGHKWNPAKRKVDVALAKSLRAQGVSVAEIAERFNCSRVAIYQALKTAP